MGSESELIFPEELGNLGESETKLKSNGVHHVEDVNEQLLEEIEIKSSSSAVNKSPGLRKWRRRPRDLVKKTSSSLNGKDNGDLTVSPVNKAADHLNGGSPVRPVFATLPDMGQKGGGSSTAASGPRVRNEVGNLNGGSTVLPDDQQRNGGTGPGKKARGFEMETSMGFDSRSFNFVSVQGRQSGMFEKYDEESSDDGHYADKHLKSDAESDDVSLAADNSGEHEGSMDKDHLVESVKELHLAQVGFEREVQKWRGVGKDDPLIFDPLHETLELKDAKILELESILNSGDIKTKLEDQLMKLIQTEVEYVVLITTTKILTEGRSLLEIKDDHLPQKNVSSYEKLDVKLQMKEDLKKVQNKVCKSTSCFIIMLLLLLVTLYLQFAPQNVDFVPT